MVSTRASKWCDMDSVHPQYGTPIAPEQLERCFLAGGAMLPPTAQGSRPMPRLARRGAAPSRPMGRSCRSPWSRRRRRRGQRAAHAPRRISLCRLGAFPAWMLGDGCGGQKWGNPKMGGMESCRDWGSPDSSEGEVLDGTPTDNFSGFARPRQAEGRRAWRGKEGKAEGRPRGGRAQAKELAAGARKEKGGFRGGGGGRSGCAGL